MKKNSLSIGFVFDDSLDKPDGVQQYILILSRWLAAQGHEVHYLVGETKRTDIPNTHSLSRNVKVRFNHNRMAMPLPTKRGPLREVLAKHHFDVLHVQVPYSPFLAGRIIELADPNTAVVGTFHIAPHSWLVTASNRLLAMWVSKSLKRFDVMIGAPAAAAFALKAFKQRSHILPLPLELNRFYAAKPMARYASGRTVVTLGRLVERKGCRYLLRAVAHAVKDGSWPADTRLVVCGGGPLEGELKHYVAENELGEIVSFEGYISEEDKPSYLASADVVVYPSTGGEGFGVVLLEAMAASPGMVLAGDNPGYASVLKGHEEQLCNPLDTPALANQIIAALSDDKARKQARAWQLAYVKQCDVAIVGQQTVEVYQEALHKRRG